MDGWLRELRSWGVGALGRWGVVGGFDVGGLTEDWAVSGLTEASTISSAELLTIEVAVERLIVGGFWGVSADEWLIGGG